MSAVVGADINLGNAKMPHTYSNRYEAFLRSFRDYNIFSVQAASVFKFVFDHKIDSGTDFRRLREHHDKRCVRSCP